MNGLACCILNSHHDPKDKNLASPNAVMSVFASKTGLPANLARADR